MGKLKSAKTPCHSGCVNNNGLTNWLMFRGSGEVSGLNFLLFLSRRIDFLNGKIGPRSIGWCSPRWWSAPATPWCATSSITARTPGSSCNGISIAAVFLIGAGYTLLRNEHVRIDIIYSRLSPRTRAWIDLLGGIFFLLPMAIIIMVLSWPVFTESFALTEYSPNAGGLLRWPVKLMIPVGFLAAGAAGRLRDHQARGLSDGPDPRSDAATRHGAPMARRRMVRSPRASDDRAVLIANMAPLMFAMLIILLMIGYPVAFSLAANGLLFGVIAIDLGLLGPELLQALPERVFGIMRNDTLLAIPFFTFMGLILERSGMAEDLLDTIGQMFGPIRGGLAYAVVFVGALLAATTGVVAASVISMGLISLPIMLRYGYDRRLAAGVIAASGTLAQIIPPSLVLIVMADQLGRSVGDMYQGAFIPGLSLAALYAVCVAHRLTIVRPELDAGAAARSASRCARPSGKAGYRLARRRRGDRRGRGLSADRLRCPAPDLGLRGWSGSAPMSSRWPTGISSCDIAEPARAAGRHRHDAASWR